MVTRYKVVHWEFNRVEWANRLKAWTDVVGFDDVADVVGVTVGCIKRWENPQYDAEFSYPSMTNFIKTCDELSLDPSHFFTTSE